jgi:hypothetical protein
MQKRERMIKENRDRKNVKIKIDGKNKGRTDRGSKEGNKKEIRKETKEKIDEGRKVESMIIACDYNQGEQKS